jgi:hypothetical protein
LIVDAAARSFGLLVSALFGFTGALLACGALAVVLDIRASLRENAHAAGPRKSRDLCGSERYCPSVFARLSAHRRRSLHSG